MTRAIMLAAGVGARLGPEQTGEDRLPKALLRIGGTTLLARHLANLRRHGIDELVVVTGYRSADIEAEIAREGAADFVRTVFNPRFRTGSSVSLAAAADVLAAGAEVLVMDADVLYEPAILRRLVDSRNATCMLLDRDIEPGEEPVKICVRAGEIVDFGKIVARAHDFHGESVGFFRFSPQVAARLADRVTRYAAGERAHEMYEEAIREVLHAEPSGTFGYEDVTGLSWIEIDFPADVERAERDVLPRIGAPL